MRNLSLVRGSTTRRLPFTWSERDSLKNRARTANGGSLHAFPSRFAADKEWSGRNWLGKGWPGIRLLYRKAEFFRQLPDEALFEFASISGRFVCPGAALILREGQEPANVLLLLEGKVKLSLNSSDGRRLIVGFASQGEILGLTSAVSGYPYEMTAEAQFPCTISSLPRQSFLDFLSRAPVACENVARQLGFENRRAIEQLRTLGLTQSAPARLAKLLLEWCAESTRTLNGTQIQCPFTHGEIGELIGTTRETISRCMNDFKRRGLVAQRGTALLVPNCAALAAYAGIGLVPDPGESAA
jgi:CRP/FNR family transcriptional regulator